MKGVKLSFKFAVSILLVSLVYLGTWLPQPQQATAYHSSEELAFMRAHLTMPPQDSSLLFPTSSLCEGCHGSDEEAFAMVTADGEDVNMYDQWQTSIMALGAKDPYWRAKMRHEAIVHPGHAADIETTCTRCHAPLGHYQALHEGYTHYTLDSVLIDTIGLDGISCHACHQQLPDQLGELNNGLMNFDSNKVAFGPYPFPFGAPMIQFAGVTPLYSEHINESGICASCHTLIVSPFDTEGNPTGESYVEQATYHEYLNSSYPAQDVSCQSCHMPQIEDSIIISDNYLFLQKRHPYGLHTLVGGNSFMLEMMKEYKSLLGIDAPDENFDSTIVRTNRLLQEQTLDINLSEIEIDADTAYYRLELTNKAGHKFPSGFGSRRAYVEFIARTPLGDTLFHSGKRDEDGFLIGHDPVFEPHHQVIRSEDQIQIYQIVSADTDGDPTTVLERAYSTPKDNRLPPLGFSINHPVYDTTRIEGNALNDPDFNQAAGIEGTGSDILYFHIPRDGFEGIIEIEVMVYYESAPRRWLLELFDQNALEINSFKAMYEASDRTPVQIQRATMTSDFPVSTIEPALAGQVKIYPNPSSHGQFTIDLPSDLNLLQVELFDLTGKKLTSFQTSSYIWPNKGIHLLRIHTDQGIVNKKLIILD